MTELYHGMIIIQNQPPARRRLKMGTFSMWEVLLALFGLALLLGPLNASLAAAAPCLTHPTARCCAP